MTNPQRNSLGERNIEQAIITLKRGSYLLKYGRRGKPKFCPFRLSSDEKTLIWYIGREENQLQLSQVSKIIPGQRTEVFQRYPRPEKEYQSFSLLYGKQSLDLICKDKDEAEIWFIALRALISKSNCQKWRSEIRSDGTSSDSLNALTQRNSQSIVSSSSSDTIYEDSRQSQIVPASWKSPQQKRLGRAFSELLYNTAGCSPQRDSITTSVSSRSYKNIDDLSGQSSADASRDSFSSAISSSSQGSFPEDFDTFCDLFIWGEGAGDGLLGGGLHRVGELYGATTDAFLPKALEATQALDVRNISCGRRHAALVTKSREIFTWGDGSGGRLGHGVVSDIGSPKLVEALSGVSIESVACGEYHTCAVTVDGDLYSWGDGIRNYGLLGHGNEISHWTPKKVSRRIDDLCVSSISCGPWHSAAVTSLGQLFTFGDGSFGALGHGDLSSTSFPREVETLKGLRTVTVSCGFWHTAAVVDVSPDSMSSNSSSNGKLFTWGNGNEGQLGHGVKASRLVPCCVTALDKKHFCKVACGHSITVALTTLGQVYTMGRADYGQLGSPGNNGWLPTCVQGKIKNNFIEQIACGSFHVVALSSKSEVYTWGKGKSGQLGHGDNNDRNTPTLVEALKSKQVKRVVCGNNFTAAICLHKRVSLANHSICSGCSDPFNFKRKRHNCYNCGLVFCKACSSKKSLKASLAPKVNKPYRVCDDCFTKLNKGSDTGLSCLPPRASDEYKHRNSGEVKEKLSLDSRSRSLLSRLSYFDSSKKFEVGHSRKNLKSNSTSHISLGRSESCQCDSSYTLSSSRSTFDFSEKVSISLPCSTMDSQAASPLSRGSSPFSSPLLTSKSMFDLSEKESISLPGSTLHSQAASPVSRGSSPFHSPFLTSSFASHAIPEVVVDDSMQKSDDPTKETSLLREQVEILTRRSNFLTSELQRTSSQLKEATELARDEIEKNNAAKEVIKSLMKQLKEMAATIPPGSSIC